MDKTLLDDFFKGDVRALARVITRVENRSSDSLDILRHLFPHTGRAQVIGVTGSPGVGKSSLVDLLATAYRQNGKTVGIVAVDPTSPFTGGAILGDRLRMQPLEPDPGVYIRSMATRGHLGGLAATTADVVTVLDAAGKDLIIVETVGVGQDEIEIVKLADISILVLVPGMGDEIQALKAGIMEIGDIFVINKCDRTGVEQMERAVLAMLTLAHRPDGWQPPIVRTVATENRGIEELLKTIEEFRQFVQNSTFSAEKKRERIRQRLLALLQERLINTAVQEAFPAGEMERVIDRIAERVNDPYSIVERILTNRRQSPRMGEVFRPSETGETGTLMETGPVLRIDHIGIAVKSLAESVKIYEEALGLKPAGSDQVDEQRVRVAMFDIGESRIELLEPTEPDSPVARFISKRGEGLHHIAVQVRNVEQVLERLKKFGIRLIDSEPRPGAHNTRIAFVHPSSTHGVLLELVDHGE